MAGMRAASVDEDLRQELLDQPEPLPQGIPTGQRGVRSYSDLSGLRSQGRLPTVPLSEFKRSKAQVDLVHRHTTVYTGSDCLAFVMFLAGLYACLLALMWVCVKGIEWDSGAMGWVWAALCALLTVGLGAAMMHAGHSPEYPSSPIFFSP